MWRKIFRFVEFTAKERKGFKKWVRIDINDLSKYLLEYHYTDIFTTIQRYRNSIPQDEEEVWHGIFFDFDSEDLNLAKEDALKVVDYFLKLGIPKEFIRIYFSGARGFHIYIEPEILGIKPHKSLTYIIRLLCINVAEFLELKTFDRNVYTIKRMWRVPNTINTKTKERRYKVELYHEELELPIEDILKIAQTPRKELWDIDYENVEPEFYWYYEQFYKAYIDLLELESLRPKKPIKIREIPVCVEDVLNNFIRKKGDRNKALVILASFFKDKGLSKEETEEILIDWSKKLPSHLTDRTEKERITNAKSVVKTVYDREYHFSCSYIRSLGSIDSPISCLKDKCPLINYYEPQTPIKVNLEDATKAVYTDLLLKTQGICAGLDYVPYLIPNIIEITCDGCDKDCVLAKTNYRAEIKIGSDDKDILNFIDSQSEYVRSLILKKIGLKKCNKVNLNIISNMNIRDIQLTPFIKFSDYSEQRTLSLIQGYYIGHDIETNKEYEITARLVSEPKKQKAVLLISNIEPIVKVEKISNELKERLNIFRTEGDPLEKFKDIWDDFEANITRIYNRHLVCYAIDIIYHTCLSFYFIDRNTPIKGWGELLIIGDTDTGKTTLAKSILNHYQLGSYVSCETTTRTGLTYSIQETKNKWMVICGILPLNDRGLVFLDEFRSLNSQDRKELTQIRSEGILQITRVRQAMIPCRNRLIYMTTPKKNLDEYGFGITSIYEIFELPEDVRRLDICIIMSSREVDKNIFKKMYDKKVQHKYTSDLCNALIRFIWNLNANQIKFTESAIKEVYNQIDRLSSIYIDEIPILKLEDLRYKITRLAIGVAGRTYNVDEKENLIIEARHIKAVGDFLDMIYSQKSCGYKELSMVSKELSNLDRYVEMIRQFVDIDRLKIFAKILLMTEGFSKTDFLSMFINITSKNNLENLFAMLIQNGLIKRVRSHYIKSETFIEVLKKILELEEEVEL